MTGMWFFAAAATPTSGMSLWLPLALWVALGVIVFMAWTWWKTRITLGDVIDEAMSRQRAIDSAHLTLAELQKALALARASNESLREQADDAYTAAATFLRRRADNMPVGAEQLMYLAAADLVRSTGDTARRESLLACAATPQEMITDARASGDLCE